MGCRIGPPEIWIQLIAPNPGTGQAKLVRVHAMHGHGQVHPSPCDPAKKPDIRIDIPETPGFTYSRPGIDITQQLDPAAIAAPTDPCGAVVVAAPRDSKEFIDLPRFLLWDIDAAAIKAGAEVQGCPKQEGPNMQPFRKMRAKRDDISPGHAKINLLKISILSTNRKGLAMKTFFRILTESPVFGLSAALPSFYRVDCLAWQCVGRLGGASKKTAGAFPSLEKPLSGLRKVGYVIPGRP
jgi:hypothetical protein